VHYLFTPTALNSKIIRLGNRLQSASFKTVQTIATLREDLYAPDQWKEMFFADKLVVYSDYSKHKLEQAGFKNISRIYPGVDLEKYSPQPKSEEALKHFNIDPTDFVLTYFGEYARLGATDMLVEMLVKHLSANRDKTQKNILFIFGCRVKNDADQKKKDEITETFKRAGILDRVRFSDTFSDMPALYNLTDIVLFPVENMRGKFDIPLVIIEGYACGKPVILSDLPIFEEFSHPDISVTVPRNNSDTLWKAIQDLMQNEAKRKSLGVNARLFVEQYFDLRNTADEYERLYKATT
jgi:phosphatidylinositol alpha-1,6-mannosyltransferase